MAMKGLRISLWVTSPSGKFGGGFLYTNRESLSLGVVIGIEDAMDDKTSH